MPATFYQRLQEYYKRPDAVKFTKTRAHKCSGLLANIWNRRKQPITYVKSEEGDFDVRLYPDDFVKIIDAFILRFEKNIIMFPSVMPKENQPKKEVIPPKKARIKKPIKKPVYTTSKSKIN